MNLAILFPGQGRQHRQMFSILRNIDHIQDDLKVLEQFLDISIEKDIVHGNNNLLFQNKYAQPLICSANYLIWKSISGKISKPIVMAGYSLGELTAYACAGCFDFPQLLSICAKRAAIMEKYAPKHSGMISIKGLAKSVLIALCAENHCYIAIINGDSHIICAGLRDNLIQLAQQAKEKGARKVVKLNINVPSHTPLLKRASEEFHQLLLDSNLKEPTIPVIANVSAETIYSKDSAIECLSRQISETVHWSKSMYIVKELGVDLFFEVGHDESLVKISQELLSEVVAKSTSSFYRIEGVISWLQNALISPCFNGH